jgi:hypothetical protein
MAALDIKLNVHPDLLVVGMIIDAAPVLSPRVVSLPKKREKFCQMAEKGFPQTIIIGSVCMCVSADAAQCMRGGKGDFL